MAESVLRRLRNPSLVSSPDAIAEEVRLGAEDLVEVEGDGHMALGGSKRRRRGSEGGGGGGVVLVVGGGVAGEIEVGEEAVGPSAGGAGDHTGGKKLLEVSRGGGKWGEARSGETNAQLSQGFHY